MVQPSRGWHAGDLQLDALEGRVCLPVGQGHDHEIRQRFDELRSQCQRSLELLRGLCLLPLDRQSGANEMRPSRVLRRQDDNSPVGVGRLDRLPIAQVCGPQQHVSPDLVRPPRDQSLQGLDGGLVGASLNLDFRLQQRGVDEGGIPGRRLIELGPGLEQVSGLNICSRQMIVGLREPGLELDDSLELVDRRAGRALAEARASAEQEPLEV